jgi:hypothetical protein
LLEHGLAGSEASGDGCGPASGDREERVDRPLTGHERLVEGEPARDRPPQPHRPPGEQRQGLTADPHDGLVDAHLPPGHPCDGACDARRDENAVPERAGLLDGAEHVASGHLVALGDIGLEQPCAAAVERGCGCSPLDHRLADRVVGAPRERRQRTLDAVEDRAEQARAELDLELLPGVGDRLPDGESGRVLVHLDDGVARVEPDHLTGEAGMAHEHHVVQTCGREPARGHHGAGDGVDRADVGRLPPHGCARLRHPPLSPRSNVIS